MGMASLLWIGIGYLLGSVPFELLLTRANGIDTRAVGSGNIGTTNVLRTGNDGLAATMLLLKAGKGPRRCRRYCPTSLSAAAGLRLNLCLPELCSLNLTFSNRPNHRRSGTVVDRTGQGSGPLQKLQTSLHALDLLQNCSSH